MIKDLILNLPLGSQRAATSEYALSVAVSFNAHIVGIAFAYDPAIPPPAFGAAVPPQWTEALRTEATAAAKSAIETFQEKAHRLGVSAETRLVEASFRDAPDLFAGMVRRFDLSIVRQAEPDKTMVDKLIVESALFDSGRPVLVAPYIQKDGIRLDRIMIGWDGSRNAARAIADALPFLRRAKTIDVVLVADNDQKADEVAGSDIAQHLARHGLSVEVNRIISKDVGVADVILSHAVDSSADFLVIGGYGHSRVREFVLGGVTRSILSTMTIPTLMAH